MKNVAIVGFMGTGKTTIAKLLAEKLKIKLIDLDAVIEKQTGMKIVDIFKDKGEVYFREIESNLVASVSKEQDQVIACGGGVVINEHNIINLKKTSVIVCLGARPAVIVARTKNDFGRPLLNVPEPEKKIAQLLAQRKIYYARADFFIDTSDLTAIQVRDKIIELINDKLED